MQITWVTALLNWFQLHQRELPWRQTKDPYAIWVSEIMLQQTRVETVVPYYRRFLERFPTVEHLAKAQIDEVLKLWEGLGYYTRAKNLHRAAQVIQQEYQSVFPRSHPEVLALPGIGDYTAGAIMSIAYGQPFPAIDGNVLRVIARLQLIQKDISLPQTKTEVAAFLKGVFPLEQASDFTQALMELGALVCLPMTPKCTLCPIQVHCQAKQRNMQQELPIKSKKTLPKREKRYLAIIQQGDKILMNKRPMAGLLGGLWEFPGVESKNKQDFVQNFKRQFGLTIIPKVHKLDTSHVFSHRIWEMKVYHSELVSGEVTTAADLHWIPVDQLNTIAIPSAFQKIKDSLLLGGKLC